MIEPILSLAMSMHANPGVYAVLVGSGVSRSAQIPTGWEVVLDLCRRLALLEHEDSGADPASWYNRKYGTDPDYSELLNAVGKSPAERQQLLRSYFEPSDEEREQGLKQPTPAHRAIAKLMANGFCRVVLTTNFDKLLERAIEDEGIAPVVLSTPDATAGALPLVHQRCCVVKLHGDYLDTRIKNTPPELATYDDRLDRLLDEVFDTFGLIVCGWSAQWDAALRAAIERCPSRRFTTYWASRGKMGEEAHRLLQLRCGVHLPIVDADSFFPKLSNLVSALHDSQRSHPSSVQAAVALIKRYLANPQSAIDLEDLVVDETESAHAVLEHYNEAAAQEGTCVARIFEAYTEALEILQQILIQGVAFGTALHYGLWVRSIERIARQEKSSGTILNDGIRHFAATLLIYSAGIVAVSRQKFAALRSLLVSPRLVENPQRPLLLRWIDSGELNDAAKTIEGYKNKLVPASDYLFAVIRPQLQRLIPDDLEYESAFDRFELLRALVFAHLEHPHNEIHDVWVPPGRYCWKGRRAGASLIKRMEAELAQQGASWPPIQGGLIDASVQRVGALLAAIRQFVMGTRR